MSTEITAKAALYRSNSNSPDVVDIEDVQKPVALPNTVIVKVHVASINPVDGKVSYNFLFPTSILLFQLMDLSFDYFYKLINYV